MRVKWIVVSLLVFYLIITAFEVLVCFGKGSHHPWLFVGWCAWILFLATTAITRDWPIISFPKPETEKIDGATYTEPILAWRLWYIKDGRLNSVCHNTRKWSPRKMFESSCWRNEWFPMRTHQVPSTECECGIYARRDVNPIFFKVYHQDTSQGEAVLGLVYLWGRIIEHDDGYRAQFAYPAKLFVRRAQDEEIIRSVAEQYGIPCEKFSWWQEQSFELGGTKWKSESQKESLRSTQLSSLFPQNQTENENQVA